MASPEGTGPRAAPRRHPDNMTPLPEFPMPGLGSGPHESLAQALYLASNHDGYMAKGAGVPSVKPQLAPAASTGLPRLDPFYQFRRETARQAQERQACDPDDPFAEWRPLPSWGTAPAPAHPHAFTAYPGACAPTVGAPSPPAFPSQQPAQMQAQVQAQGTWPAATSQPGHAAASDAFHAPAQSAWSAAAAQAGRGNSNPSSAGPTQDPWLTAASQPGQKATSESPAAPAQSVRAAGALQLHPLSRNPSMRTAASDNREAPGQSASVAGGTQPGRAAAPGAAAPGAAAPEAAAADGPAAPTPGDPDRPRRDKKAAGKASGRSSRTRQSKTDAPASERRPKAPACSTPDLLGIFRR